MPVRPDRMRRTAAGRVCALDLAPGVGLAVSLRRHEPGMQVRLGVCVRPAPGVGVAVAFRRHDAGMQVRLGVWARPCPRRRAGRRFQAARPAMRGVARASPRCC